MVIEAEADLPSAQVGSCSDKPREYSKETRIKCILKLLSQRGEKNIRERITSGRGIRAKDTHFDCDILEEALQRWASGSTAKENLPAQEVKSQADVSAAQPSPSPPKVELEKRKVSVMTDGEAFSLFDENDDPQVASTRAPKKAKKDKKDKKEKHKKNKKDTETEPPSKSPVDRCATTADERSPGATGATPPVAPAASNAPPNASSAGTVGTTIGKTIKELKTLLSAHDLDASSCVEKSELESLWNRFSLFRSKTLTELHNSCASSGGPRFGNVDECARFLAQPPVVTSGGKPATTSAAATCTSDRASAESRLGAAGSTTSLEGDDGAGRERDAVSEASRVSSLKRTEFTSNLNWGFAVLGLDTASPDQDVTAVQRAYRALMRKLHPDKVGCNSGIASAVEMIREAKELCERGLSRQSPPGLPRSFSFTAICMTPGKRRIRLQWQRPLERASAPVQKYAVAVVDPAYGRALTVAILEPDYCEERRRFVSVDELTSYVLAEEVLQKMPKLWEQPYATVQVAASNEVGQSPWASLLVPLNEPGRSFSAPCAADGTALRSAAASAASTPFRPPRKARKASD